MTSYECLEMAAHAGELLLSCGGEVRRVNTTMEHILNHCGYSDYHIFVISNGIFATLNEKKEDRCHIVRRVEMLPMNMNVIIQVNEISRQLTSNQITPFEAHSRFNEITVEDTPNDRLFMTFACGVSGAAFTAILGNGSIYEVIAAFFLGILLQIFLYLFPNQIPKFMADICASLFITMLTAFLCLNNIHLTMNAIIPGVIICMVPGVAFTTSIRDFMHCDFLSGVIHLADATLTLIGIALGIGLALGLMRGIL